MHKLKSFFVLLFLLVTVSFFEANADTSQIKPYQKDYYQYFDTILSITIYSDQTVTDSQWTDIENIIKHIQITFKRDAPAEGEQPSELYRLNQTAGTGKAFQCSDDLYEVIKIGMDYAKLTNGKLDPAIGPLVDLWDITGNQARIAEGEDPIVPTKEQIDALLPLVDYTKVIMDDTNKTVTLPDKGMVIDLGAIAKGFAADKIAEYFDTQGFKHAMINLGGNIYAYGDRYAKNDKGSYDWSISIRDPKGTLTSILGIVYLNNQTIVSSGIYERNFTDPKTGKFYHHILDPDTGYPVDNTLAAVSIITKSSTLADALSTSVFSLGLEDGLKFIENQPDTDALFVTKDDKVYKTPGFDEKYHYYPMNTTQKEEKVKDNYIVPTIFIGVGVVAVVGVAIFLINKFTKPNHNA